MNAAWELDFWGRFRRSVEVADANLDVSIAGYDDVMVILSATVASTYVETRAIQRRLELTRNIADLQRGSLEIAKARFKAELKNNVEFTESAFPLLEAQLRIANNRLCVLLGIPPEDLVHNFPRCRFRLSRVMLKSEFYIHE